MRGGSAGLWAHAGEQVFDELAARGIGRWILQPFRAAGCLSQALVDAPLRDTVVDAALLAQLRSHVPGVAVRE
jgi:hypothetical protein